MITATILKEIAIRLEHDASPIFIAIVVAGKTFKLEDPNMLSCCERIAHEINEAIRIQKNIEATEEIYIDRYAEYEDL